MNRSGKKEKFDDRLNKVKTETHDELANHRHERQILEFRLNTTTKNFNFDLMKKVKVLESKNAMNDELKVKIDKVAELEIVNEESKNKEENKNKEEKNSKLQKPFEEKRGERC